MKAKVLFTYYTDGSGLDIVRVYLGDDFDQAESDFEMMQKFSDSRTWKLVDAEIFGEPKKNYLTQEFQVKNENTRIFKPYKKKI